MGSVADSTWPRSCVLLVFGCICIWEFVELLVTAKEQFCFVHPCGFPKQLQNLGYHDISEASGIQIVAIVLTLGLRHPSDRSPGCPLAECGALHRVCLYVPRIHYSRPSGPYPGLPGFKARGLVSQAVVVGVDTDACLHHHFVFPSELPMREINC